MPEHDHARLDLAVFESIQRPPEVCRITVTVVEFRRGEGCCEADPVRLCWAYYRDDGTLITVVDSWLDQPVRERR